MAGYAGGGGGGRGGSDGEDVYATLLLTDTYLPGALVLAHSLRDAGTTKKLAVLVTLDSVSAQAIAELRSVYDYIIAVPRIRNSHPANLELMNRTDLHSAFTKINLWKQTQFRKIVYIDADVVAYRAPDELFNIAYPFSAAPDIGWPDLFNTGVMVLTPNIGDHYAMMAMAERGISFDGADQGLINMHFRNNYNRISFTYNVTPSAHYQYIPAYRHFQSSINMVHFIGSDKPWLRGRHANFGNSPFDEMTGRWWAVYDRHYRVLSPQPTPSASAGPSAGLIAGSSTATTTISPRLEFVQYFTKGEFQPQPRQSYQEPSSSKPYEGLPHGHHVAMQVQEPEHHQIPHQQEGYNYTHITGAPEPIAVRQVHHDHHDAHDRGSSWSEVKPQQFNTPSLVSTDVVSSSSNTEDTPAEAHEEQFHAQEAPVVPSEPEKNKPEPFQLTMSAWDAQRHPPPSESKPEAINFPATTYEMSKSSLPFVPPERYPSPPKDMWYEVPKESRTTDTGPLKPIFPWEANRPKPSRVFVDSVPQVTTMPEANVSDAPSGEPWPLPEANPLAESTALETSTIEGKSEPLTPLTPAIQITPAVDLWSTYTRTNAWDELPEINRYMDSMQKHRRTRSLKAPGVIDLPGIGVGADEAPWRRRGSKLTDFPSEEERPSLPVTPAPVRRPNFWGGGSGMGGTGNGPSLPAAADVPGQSDWDPVAQLEKLAKQHSEQLLEKLSSTTGRDSSDLPPRLLPFGSEKLASPTYVAQSPKMISPQPVKASSTSSSSVLNFAPDSEATPRASPRPRPQSSAAKTVVAGPSSPGGQRWASGNEETVPAPGTAS